MAKLSNVVGGLMRDLAQSHTISDAFTVDVLDTYRRDTVLAQIPVPRLSIREARLTLRFAVDAVEDREAVLEPAELQDLWLEAVRDRVVPKALTEVGRIDNKRVVGAFERRLKTGGATVSIDPETLANDGREEELIASTLGFLAREVDALPPSTRKSFEGTDLAGSFERIVRSEIPELRSAVRQLATARRASQADLTVSVTTESLAAVPQHQISELVLTVSMEEVQSGTLPDLGDLVG